MPDQNEQVARKLYEEVSSGDVDAFLRLLAPDAVDHNPDPEQGPGPEGIRAGFEVMRGAFPDLRMTVEDIVAAGDKVVCRVRVSGTHDGEFMGNSATGKRFSSEVIDILRFEDGKVKERWGVFDGLTMMQQLGLAPPTPSS